MISPPLPVRSPQPRNVEGTRRQRWAVLYSKGMKTRLGVARALLNVAREGSR